MGESRVSPILVGALLAALVVGGAGAAAVWRSMPKNTATSASADKTVLVAVALPDLDGVVAPRAITVYTIGGGRVTTVSVDPGTTTTVPGTSSRMLSDAYLYGGGDLLASSYAALKGTPTPEWVVVDAPALGRLMGGRDVEMYLPVPIDVYDGAELSSFATGTVSISQAQLPKLMDGVGYLAPGVGGGVRDQLSKAVLTSLARSSVSLQEGVRTSMQPLELEQWLERLSMEGSSTPAP